MLPLLLISITHYFLYLSLPYSLHSKNLMWKIFVFYSYNAALLSTDKKAAEHKNMDVKVPVFRSVAKYEKKLLEETDLWQMMDDFHLVPVIIKYVHISDYDISYKSC
jgi:hypothetical protein